MANSEEMRRLVMHAATLLEIQRDTTLKGSGYTNDVQVVAVTSYGAAILRMVAACMSVEETAPKAAAQRGDDGRFVKGESQAVKS